MSAVRVAMTETINAYAGMPATVEELPSLAGKLDDIRKANVDHHVALMRIAAASGVKAIGFGELFPGPYFALEAREMWKGLAEDAAEGPTVTAIRAAAKAEKMIVVAPIYERARDGRRFNTAVVIDETGAILGTFRKTHIPFGTNEQGTFVENFYYERSDGGNTPPPKTGANLSANPFFPVFHTSIGRIGVAICYDRHFEGVMHSLAKEGAELVFSPAVTFGQKSERMWTMEFPVDAARHRLFIGGSNRLGAEKPWGQPFFGKTFFCGPNGVAPNVSPDPRLVIAEIDLGELTRPDPSGWNLPRDIRYDIYSKRG
ncbi:MAG TPA: nitrilase-related carbon-nitrogen hydrolase [bacterium]|nr:nitrilase-related carbon-nitrogen hydrolase [bacterium]